MSSKLKKWMEKKLSDQSIPGLEYTIHGKRFKLPWKHTKGDTWSDEDDGKIFLEFAKHLGLYRPGAAKEYPLWKMRLRVALHQCPDIQEQRNLTQRQGIHPYRVFDFVETKVQRHQRKISTSLSGDSDTSQTGTEESEEIVVDSDHPMVELPSGAPPFFLASSPPQDTSPSCDIMSDMMQSLQTTPIESTAFPGIKRRSPSHYINQEARFQRKRIKDEDPDEVLDHHPGEGTSPSADTYDSVTASISPAIADKVMDELGLEQAIAIGQEGFIDMDDNMLSFPDMFPSLSDGQGGDSPHNVLYSQQIPETKENTVEGQGIPMDAMHITLYYKGDVVEDMWTSNTNGCLLLYQPTPQGTSAHPAASQQCDLELITFPDCVGRVKPSSHETLVNRLLTNLTHGIVLECQNGDIYATRHCRCSIFYSNFTMTNQDANKLEYNKRTKVFDYTELCQAECTIEDKLETQVYLGFGQRWNYGQSAKSISISAHVTSGRITNETAV